MNIQKLDSSYFTGILSQPNKGETHVLPGFVENGVTYESHTFTVRLAAVNHGVLGYSKDNWTPDTRVPRCQSAVLHVRHGGGEEAWSLSKKLAEPLRALLNAGLTREAFFMCWGIADAERELRRAGADEQRQECFKAFVDGRLKKRKQPGSASVKVWIEARPVAPATAA